MVDGLDPMQVAAGAAAVLVADMLKKSWESARDAMERIFRRGREADDVSVGQELELLDTAHRRLNESAEFERADLVKRMQQELQIQLGAFLQKNRGLVPDLQELVDQSDQTGEGSGVLANVYGNIESQVIIGGRDVSTGNFTSRAPESEK